MRKLILWLSLALAFIVFFTVEVYASVGGFIDSLVSGYGGYFAIGVIVVSFAIIWIIRATKTKKDDAILDNYIQQGIKFALSIMPKNTDVNWIKLTKNALQKFTEIYAKELGAAPDAGIYDKAKSLIEEIAKEKAELPKN